MLNITARFYCFNYFYFILKLSLNFDSETASDEKESKGFKRKQNKKPKDNCSTELDDKTDEKNNPFDFFKFAERTAQEIKTASDIKNIDGSRNIAPPPRWLNKRPKITYSTMCAMAIQVNMVFVRYYRRVILNIILT